MNLSLIVGSIVAFFVVWLFFIYLGYKVGFFAYVNICDSWVALKSNRKIRKMNYVKEDRLTNISTKKVSCYLWSVLFKSVLLFLLGFVIATTPIVAVYLIHTNRGWF